MLLTALMLVSKSPKMRLDDSQDQSSEQPAEPHLRDSDWQ